MSEESKTEKVVIIEEESSCTRAMRRYTRRFPKKGANTDAFKKKFAKCLKRSDSRREDPGDGKRLGDNGTVEAPLQPAAAQHSGEKIGTKASVVQTATAQKKQMKTNTTAVASSPAPVATANTAVASEPYPWVPAIPQVPVKDPALALQGAPIGRTRTVAGDDIRHGQNHLTKAQLDRIPDTTPKERAAIDKFFKNNRFSESERANGVVSHRFKIEGAKKKGSPDGGPPAKIDIDQIPEVVGCSTIVEKYWLPLSVGIPSILLVNKLMAPGRWDSGVARRIFDVYRREQPNGGQLTSKTKTAIKTALRVGSDLVPGLGWVADKTRLKAYGELVDGVFKPGGELEVVRREAAAAKEGAPTQKGATPTDKPAGPSRSARIANAIKNKKLKGVGWLGHVVLRGYIGAFVWGMLLLKSSQYGEKKTGFGFLPDSVETGLTWLVWGKNLDNASLGSQLVEDHNKEIEKLNDLGIDGGGYACLIAIAASAFAFYLAARKVRTSWKAGAVKKEVFASAAKREKQIEAIFQNAVNSSVDRVFKRTSSQWAKKLEIDASDIQAALAPLKKALSNRGADGAPIAKSTAEYNSNLQTAIIGLIRSETIGKGLTEKGNIDWLAKLVKEARKAQDEASNAAAKALKARIKRLGVATTDNVYWMGKLKKIIEEPGPDWRPSSDDYWRTSGRGEFPMHKETLTKYYDDVMKRGKERSEDPLTAFLYKDQLGPVGMPVAAPRVPRPRARGAEGARKHAEDMTKPGTADDMAAAAAKENHIAMIIQRAVDAENSIGGTWVIRLLDRILLRRNSVKMKNFIHGGALEEAKEPLIKILARAMTDVSKGGGRNYRQQQALELASSHVNELALIVQSKLPEWSAKWWSPRTLRILQKAGFTKKQLMPALAGSILTAFVVSGLNDIYDQTEIERTGDFPRYAAVFPFQTFTAVYAKSYTNIYEWLTTQEENKLSILQGIMRYINRSTARKEMIISEIKKISKAHFKEEQAIHADGDETKFKKLRLNTKLVILKKISSLYDPLISRAIEERVDLPGGNQALDLEGVDRIISDILVFGGNTPIEIDKYLRVLGRASAAAARDANYEWPSVKVASAPGVERDITEDDYLKKVLFLGDSDQEKIMGLKETVALFKKSAAASAEKRVAPPAGEVSVDEKDAVAEDNLDVHPEDLDALASMLVAETGMRRESSPEATMAVALERWFRLSGYQSRGMQQIVGPKGDPEKKRGQAWNNSEKYKDDFLTADGTPAVWARAQKMAREGLQNPTKARAEYGYATFFIHPDNMAPPKNPGKSSKKEFKRAYIDANISGFSEIFKKEKYWLPTFIYKHFDSAFLVPGEKILASNHSWGPEPKEKNKSTTKEGVQEMKKLDLEKLVKEVINENTGQGYAPYPYGSSVSNEEEPHEDFIESWKALELEVTQDKTRSTAVELAKILVQDLELFNDVLDLTGKNQSVATEILNLLKQSREKS